MRELSGLFFEDLKNDDGRLYPLLERVKQDHTLMLAIRDGYINIYYRGGNILKLSEQGQNGYIPFFDMKYNKHGKSIPLGELPASISNRDHILKWIDAFPYLKSLMDSFFAENNKPEREFQQMVARENNYSTISNESEYFVSDIEFAADSARFDMLAIRWLASKRKNGSQCKPALIEMKYGDDALDGSAGLIKHLEDIEKLVADENRYGQLLKTMEAQINQLDQLGLLKFNHSKGGTEIKLDSQDKPEVILLLANHNPRSIKLKNILENQKFIDVAQSQKFDLKFFAASFAGYGMHGDCMLSLDEFRQLLEIISGR